eukprot:scaffold7911_cov46-Prasinocladus_malaysianus.AAC.1
MDSYSLLRAIICMKTQPLPAYLVEHEDDGQLVLIEDAAGLQHVAHESLRVGAVRRIHHKGDHRGKRGRKALRDDVARGRPGKDLNLSWSVHHDQLGHGVPWLLAQRHHLVKPGGKKV